MRVRASCPNASPASRAWKVEGGRLGVEGRRSKGSGEGVEPGKDEELRCCFGGGVATEPDLHGTKREEERCQQSDPRTGDAPTEQGDAPDPQQTGNCWRQQSAVHPEERGEQSNPGGEEVQSLRDDTPACKVALIDKKPCGAQAGGNEALRILHAENVGFRLTGGIGERWIGRLLIGGDLRHQRIGKGQ